jgi:hypothetical protein
METQAIIYDVFVEQFQHLSSSRCGESYNFHCDVRTYLSGIKEYAGQLHECYRNIFGHKPSLGYKRLWLHMANIGFKYVSLRGKK